MTSDKSKFITIIFLLTAFFGYSFYIYSSLPVKKYSITKMAADGKMTWQQYNCSACHQVYGLGGYLGPDLTNVYSSRGPGYIKAFLANGTATMPDFHLTAVQMNAITEWFKTIDQTGSSDPRTFTIHYDGTIEQ